MRMETSISLMSTLWEMPSKKDVNVAQTSQKLAQRILEDLKFEKEGHDLSRSERLEVIKLFLNHIKGCKYRRC